MQGDRDLRSEQSMQQRLETVYHHIETYALRCQDLLATEQQQLSCERCRAIRGFHDLHDIGQHIARRLTGMQHRRCQLGTPANHRQQILEIVRDSSGHPTKRIHLLCMTQFRFERRSHRRARSP